jgi:hypothetical protein
LRTATDERRGTYCLVMSPMRRRRKRFDTGNKKSPARFNPVI